MNDFKYISKQRDDIFEYRKHRNTNAKEFLKYLISKGILTKNIILEVMNETNEEITSSIIETIDEQTTSSAQKINEMCKKVLR